MKGWFENLDSNKQIFMVIVCLVLLIVIFQIVVRQPLKNQLEVAERSLSSNQQSLRTVESIKVRVQELESQQNTIQEDSSQSLSSVINNSLSGKQFELSSMQQLSSDAIQLQINGTEFSAILGWIYELEQIPGVILDNLNVSALDEGKVNVTLGLTKVN